MERAVCKQKSGVARKVPSDQLLYEQRDRDAGGRRGRGFCGLWTRESALQRGVRVSSLEYAGVPNTCLNIESGRRFITGVMAPGTGATIDAPLARLALKSCSLGAENCADAEHDRFLQESNRLKNEIEHLEKSRLEKDAR